MSIGQINYGFTQAVKSIFGATTVTGIQKNQLFTFEPIQYFQNICFVIYGQVFILGIVATLQDF